MPTKLEYLLAEMLIDLVPSAEMVRFAKNGSDVTSAAIRLARAYTKRDKIITCGYHSWHDWYIASNLDCMDNLNSQLLPGLHPNGVPKELAGTAIPFHYNDL